MEIRKSKGRTKKKKPSTSPSVITAAGVDEMTVVAAEGVTDRDEIQTGPMVQKDTMGLNQEEMNKSLTEAPSVEANSMPAKAVEVPPLNLNPAVTAETQPNDEITPQNGISAQSPELDDFENYSNAELMAQEHKILERLTKIRAFKRQILDMLDRMKEENPEDFDRDMLRRLVASYDNFKEQEEEYVGILEKIIALITELLREQQLFQALKQAQGSSAENEEESGTEGTTVASQIEADTVQQVDETATVGDDNTAAVDDEDLKTTTNAVSQQEQLMQMIATQQSKMKEMKLRNQMLLERQDEETRLVQEESAKVRRLVSNEMEAVKAKRKELDRLKSLMLAKENGETVENVEIEPAPQLPDKAELDDEVEKAGENAPADRTDGAADVGEAEFFLQFQSKLKTLKENKQRMNAILGELNGLRDANDSNVRLASTAVADAKQGDDDEADEDADATVSAVKEQLEELSSTHGRLSELQRLVAQVQSYQDRDVAVPSELSQRVAELSSALGLTDDDDEAPTAEESDEQQEEQMTRLNQSARAAYEAKLSEQQTAVHNLHQERTRLNEIKQEMQRVQQQHPSNGLPDDGPPPRGLYYREVEVETEATGDGGIDEESSAGDSVTRHPATVRQVYSAREPPSQTQRRTYEPTSARNPRAATSARRPVDRSTPCSSTNERPLSSASSSRRQSAVDTQQINQLQHHFSSIKNIFEELNYQDSTSGGSDYQQPQPPQRRHTSSGRRSATPLGDEATAMLQAQHQTQMLLSSSLMACQQQLQSQQMEMRGLQATIAQMATMMHQTFGQQTPAGQTSDDPATMHLPPAMGAYVQQRYDTRPLSSASLYNLFTPPPPMFAAGGLPPMPPPQMLNQTWAAGGGMPFGYGTGGTAAGKTPVVGAKRTATAKVGDKAAATTTGQRKASKQSVTSTVSRVSSCQSGTTNGSVDAMRENIYSEVAALIAENEERPDFLVELFKELQLLGNEYLRERALMAIRDLLSRYNSGASGTEATNTNTGVTTKQISGLPVGVDGDQGQLLNSALKKSAKTEAKLRRQRTLERIRNRSESVSSASAVSDQEGSKISESSNLEKQIEEMLNELIPFVKESGQSPCNEKLLLYLRKMIMTLVESKCLSDGAMTDFFHHQLSSILDDTLAKYQGQRLEAVREELLTDVSEVTFNELAFFRLMRNIDSLDAGQTQATNKARRQSLMVDAEREIRSLENERRSPRRTPQPSPTAAKMPAVGGGGTPAVLLLVPGTGDDDGKSDISEETVRTAINCTGGGGGDGERTEPPSAATEEVTEKPSTPRLPKIVGSASWRAGSGDAAELVEEEISVVQEDANNDFDVTFDLKLAPAETDTTDRKDSFHSAEEADRKEQDQNSLAMSKNV